MRRRSEGREASSRSPQMKALVQRFGVDMVGLGFFGVTAREYCAAALNCATSARPEFAF
jgi:hypothetical protein